MRIGILGSGLMGGKLGTIFARAGMKSCSAMREATISSSGSRDRLDPTRGPGTPGEASKDADVLLLAIHWLRIDDVLQKAGDLLASDGCRQHETDHRNHDVGR
jgi:predicted dinucleotide-binding enzyme